MSRMAVPAKAAMALRMLVPRLLLTCRGEGDGGWGVRQQWAEEAKERRRVWQRIPLPRFQVPGASLLGTAYSWCLSLLPPWDIRRVPPSCPFLEAVGGSRRWGALPAALPTLSAGPLLGLTRQLVCFLSAATDRDPEMMNCGENEPSEAWARVCPAWALSPGPQGPGAVQQKQQESPSCPHPGP